MASDWTETAEPPTPSSMANCDFGTPYGEHSTDPINEWSQKVFAACRDWPLACASQWFRSNEGWLTLRIAEFEDEPLEPIFVIELDTADEQINLDFGSWATPISRSGETLNVAAQRAVAQGRELIEGWLNGEVKLASYSDETGWRGSKVIYGGELPAEIAPVPVTLGKHGSVTTKTPRRSDWRKWSRDDNGVWIECEPTET